MAQAGFYKDPPSRRMAFDADGTQVYRIDYTNTITQLDEATLQALNNETDNTAISIGDGHGFGYMLFIFPELRDITHLFLLNGAYFFGIGQNISVSWSVNTTNGLDGDWSTAPDVSAPTGVVKPSFREDLQTLSLGAIKGLRLYYPPFGVVSQLHIISVHLYGNKSAGQTPHRIDFVAADNSELQRDFDYGDQPRASDRLWGVVDTWNEGSALYLRNRSPDKVASDVHLTIEALSDEMDSDMTLSKDNSTYNTQLVWTDIQPNTVVGPIYVKQSTQSDETLGLRASRLKVVVGTWI